MEELFLGAMESGAVTAQQCKTSWRTLVRFRLQVPLLQPSLQMGELLPGAIKTMAATAQKFKTGCGMLVRFRLLSGLLQPSP